MGEYVSALLPIPPLPEQAAIVHFLDHMDWRIRRYIRAKQKLIKLLEEQKQVIIHHAVTRGLDPNVRLKPSGIDWLGDVPEYWEIKRLKYVVPKVTVGIVIQPAQLYVAEGVLCLRSLNISSGVIKSNDLVYISHASNQLQRKSQIHTGDIVVVRTGQAGVAAIVTEEYEGANCVDLLIIRKSNRVLSEYLLVFLNSYAARKDVEYNSVGAIQAHYNTGTLANLLLPLPSVEDQRAILEYLEAELAPLQAAMTHTEHEITLLREYRVRLIADVVTGKLDVREVAARLPDEAEESEPLDDTAALSDADEDATDDLDAASEEDEP